MKSLFILILISSSTMAQVCLAPGLQLDHSCKCGPNCDSFFDKEYLQVLKNSKIDNKKLRPILENQKATAAAYNKIVRDIPVSEAELAQVAREGRTLDKMNAHSLVELNKLMAKKGKKQIDLKKAVKEYDKQFLASLSPKLKQQIKNGPSARGAGAGVGVSALDNMDESDESSTEESSESMAYVGDEDELLETEKPAEAGNFAYRNEISMNSADNIFTIVSSRYFFMYREERLLKIKIHEDSEEDKKVKAEMRKDIKTMLKHSEDH